MRTRPLPALVLAVVLAVVLAATAAACGGDDEPTGARTTPAATATPAEQARSPRILTRAEARAALITRDDLGPGFQVEDEPDSEDSTRLGCISEAQDTIKAAGKIRTARKQEADYEAVGTLGAPKVAAFVGSLRSADQVVKGLDRFEKALAGCTRATGTSAEGFRAEVEVSVDRARSAEEVTRQANLTATGSGSVSGIRIPLSFRISMMQVGNQVLVISYLAMSDDAVTDSERLNQRAVARLTAALAGEDPDLPPLDLHVTTEQDLVAAQDDGDQAA